MHYTYLHINETGVFYVGCGLLKRTWPRWKGTSAWKSKALSGYSILVVGEFDNYLEAAAHEKYLISIFPNLVNQTLGGEVHSKETRLKMSLNNLGIKNPRYGKKANTKTLEKMSQVHKGKKLSQEQKDLYSKRFSGAGNPMYGRSGGLAPCYGRTGEKHPMFGKHQSQEAKDKISKSLKNQPRYQCSCGFITPKGSMGMHQKAKGHIGLTLLKEKV